MIKRILVMPKILHPFSPNLVRHLLEKGASCPGTGQPAILDLQDQLRGPLAATGIWWRSLLQDMTVWVHQLSPAPMWVLQTEAQALHNNHVHSSPSSLRQKQSWQEDQCLYQIACMSRKFTNCMENHLSNLFNQLQTSPTGPNGCSNDHAK